MTDPILELDHVTVDRSSGRGSVRALDEVDLEVSTGEVVAVMGPSGSGKTSIVQVGCGVLGPTSGAVRIDGEERSASERRQWARLRRRRSASCTSAWICCPVSASSTTSPSLSSSTAGRWPRLSPRPRGNRAGRSRLARRGRARRSLW